MKRRMAAKIEPVVPPRARARRRAGSAGFRYPVMIVLLLALVAGVATTQATVLTVTEGGEYGSLQAAVDAASPGDTLVVASGTYQGPVRRHGPASRDPISPPKAV